jgi:hypothetical protein
MHHAGLWVDGGLHLHLYVCKVIHPLLESSDPLEFSSTDGLEDGGKFFVQTNPLRLVHIVHTSVSKLSMAEVLILLHLCDGMDGDIIAIHGQRNVLVCRIVDRSRGLMRRRHEGRRPCGILWSITGAWPRASAGRARWECSLYSTYPFLHPA